MINTKSMLDKYNRALLGSNDVLWEWDLDNDEMFFSEGFHKITGFGEDDFKNLMDFIDRISLIEDRNDAFNELSFYTKQASSFYYSTFRIETSEKEVKWILLRGKIFNNEKKRLFSGSMSDVTVAKNMEEQVKFMTNHDYLTGLPNRNYFYKKLKEQLNKDEHTNKHGTLILIDIDNFKSINDSFGHDYGDALIKIFSLLINSIMSEYGDLVRLGGDEFIIYIKEFTNIETINNICNRIINYLEKPFEVMGKYMFITASMGITMFPEDSKYVNELLKYTDLAMYQSKGRGKNQYTFFNHEMAQVYHKRNALEFELKRAIVKDELYLFYQPQINAITNEINGIEALIRWNNNKLGIVSPTDFIPIAEEIGFIEDIGEWVLNEAIKKASIWKQNSYDFKKLSVNISAIQLKSDCLKKNIEKILKKYDVEPNSLEIEITESTLIDICKENISILNEIMKMGVNIAIDDFGTGYSSLNYLITLPVNTLKIDKSFIDNIQNEKNQSVIKCIVGLSKSLNYKIIIEGVETKQQYELLMELGCNIIQGYYFSKPLSGNDIDNVMENNLWFGGV
jgi:diguanylate cyclase (GGDEF)-like protein/PAS domain S-box-containing protein